MCYTRKGGLNVTSTDKSPRCSLSPQAIPAAQPMPSSGRQITITHGGYVAEIASVGASLRSLRYEGRNLIVPFSAQEISPCFHGHVLAPWPNRLSDGTYSFDGETRHVPLTEPERANALHGLVTWLDWTITTLEPASAQLRTLIAPQPGYPWPVEITCTYCLGDSGLEWEVRACNLGDRPAPYAVSTHPYLCPQLPRDSTERVDEWSLSIPAGHVLETTPDRLLPVRLHDVAAFEGGTLDFRSGRVIGDTRIDHAFTQLAAGEVTLVGSEGGVRLEWDPEKLPWVQAFTSDIDVPGYNRTGVAVEAMSCPPDALTSGEGIITLRPGEEYGASWQIGAL